jgi:hypothetical protein
MGKQVCSNGHEWKTRFQPSPRERWCPEDGCGLPAEPSLKAKHGGPSLSKPESRVLADAHTRFSILVCEWPCWFAERRDAHSCWGDIDPHHLVPASFIKEQFGTLPDPELADILYAPIIGVSLCRKAHEAVEKRVSQFIFWHELDPECKDFCRRIDRKYASRHPKPQSMLERLKLESPQKSKTRLPKEAATATSDRSSE